MQFIPSVKAVDSAIKSQGWYGWMRSNRIDGEPRKRIGIDRGAARRNISLRLTRLFMCIAEILQKRNEKDMCVLHFGLVQTEFRSPVREKILAALRLSYNEDSEEFTDRIAEELLAWVKAGHRPDLFKLEKPNMLVLARQK